jgi:hypothetical protein
LQIGDQIHPESVASAHLIADPWEDSLEHLLAARQEDMDVPSLRHASPKDWLGGKAVALDDGHALGMRGQHLCREQACHAAPDDKRMLKRMRGSIWHVAFILFAAARSLKKRLLAR